MKVTYLPHNSSRVGKTVPIYELEDGEIGKCYGWDNKRLLLWYVDGERVYKKKYYPNGDLEHDWAEQTSTTFQKKRSFNRQVEIIE